MNKIVITIAYVIVFVCSGNCRSSLSLRLLGLEVSTEWANQVPRYFMNLRCQQLLFPIMIELRKSNACMLLCEKVWPSRINQEVAVKRVPVIAGKVIKGNLIIVTDDILLGQLYSSYNAPVVGRIICEQFNPWRPRHSWCQQLLWISGAVTILLE